MTPAPTFPSPVLAHRRADLAVHLVGFTLILGAGGALLFRSVQSQSTSIILAVIVYVLCGLASNLASQQYHFSHQHLRRKLFRRIDHSAIYLSITGTFTPLLVNVGTSFALSLLGVCWVLTGAAIYKKVTDEAVKSKWSTASYFGLGAVGLGGLPAVFASSPMSGWCILAGSVFYGVGAKIYSNKTLPYRFAIWHVFVNLGGAAMFVGVWRAVF